MVERLRRRDKDREAQARFGISALVECLRSHSADMSEAQGRADKLLEFGKRTYDVTHRHGNDRRPTIVTIRRRTFLF